MTSSLRNLQEKSIEKSLNVGAQKSKFASPATNGAMKPLNEELQEAAEELKKKQKEDLKQLKHLDLSSYQVSSLVIPTTFWFRNRPVSSYNVKYYYFLEKLKEDRNKTKVSTADKRDFY
jgi:hypothetical protein